MSNSKIVQIVTGPGYHGPQCLHALRDDGRMFERSMEWHGLNTPPWHEVAIPSTPLPAPPVLIADDALIDLVRRCPWVHDRRAIGNLVREYAPNLGSIPQDKRVEFVERLYRTSAAADLKPGEFLPGAAPL